jgi:hypothetical protein
MTLADKNSILKELQAIQSEVEVEISDSPQEAQERGNYLAAQIARTGKLLADAKIHRDRKLNSSIIEQMKKISQLPATTANKFADALCEEENYLVNWCERLNRTCTHQLDWCRTILSKAKAEMQAFPTR